jgi:hypothetical protein
MREQFLNRQALENFINRRIRVERFIRNWAMADIGLCLLAMLEVNNRLVLGVSALVSVIPLAVEQAKLMIDTQKIGLI